MTVTLRDGRKATVILTDLRGRFPILLRADNPHDPNDEVTIRLSREGRFSAFGEDHSLDIVEGLVGNDTKPLPPA